MISREAILEARLSRMGENTVHILSQATVGIAGLGGLGSHIAAALARMGVGKLVLADFDRVELANLHRQYYLLSQVGMEKTQALVQQLEAVDPYLTYETHQTRITPENLPKLFGSCQVLCEAFDRPEEKAMLVETALERLPDILVISGSGMAGMGSANLIHTRKAMGRLYLCGDEVSQVEREGSLFASRVQVCAAHQANGVLRLLLGLEP